MSTDSRLCSVSAVQALSDPTEWWTWMCCEPANKALTVPDIDRPVEVWEEAEFQLGRIAYFVRCGWSDPISVDVGCFGWVPDWPVLDGNHRLYAAIVRGDVSILVEASGDLDLANQLLNPDRLW